MKQLTVETPPKDKEMLLLSQEGPTIESFANLGPKNSIQQIHSNQIIQDANEASCQNHFLVVGNDVNANIRAFYYCLLDWCFPKGIVSARQQLVLLRFKRKIYQAEPHNQDFESIPIEFRKLYRYKGFLKVLAQFMVKLDSRTASLTALLHQYPIIDTILAAVLRSCLGDDVETSKPVPLNRLVAWFSGLGFPCSQNGNQVSFPYCGKLMLTDLTNTVLLIQTSQPVTEIADEVSKNSPMSPISPIHPRSPHAYMRQLSTVSIQFSEGEMARDQQQQRDLDVQMDVMNYESPAHVKEVDSIYIGEDRNNSSVVEKHSKVQDYFRIKLFDADMSLGKISIHEQENCAGSATTADQSECNFKKTEPPQTARFEVLASPESKQPHEPVHQEREPLAKLFSIAEMSPSFTNAKIETEQHLHSPVYQIGSPRIEAISEHGNEDCNSTPPISNFYSRISSKSDMMRRMVDLKERYVSNMTQTPVITIRRSPVTHKQPIAFNTTSALRVPQQSPSPQRQVASTRVTPTKHTITHRTTASQLRSTATNSANNLVFKYIGSPARIVVCTPEREVQFPNTTNTTRREVKYQPLNAPLTFQTHRSRRT